MIVFPNCKINLGLHILQKRPDGFHDLETIFYPVGIHDALEMVRNPADAGVQLTVTGFLLDTPPGQNICVKAWDLLKKIFPHLPPVRIHLHKVIPSGAGLGGGSSDGAFALMLMSTEFNLGLSPQQLIDYALQLGSDCPFFVINKPCLAGGRGEKLTRLSLDLSQYHLVLIYPGIHVNTGWAFSKIKPNNDRPGLNQIMSVPVHQWKNQLVNDFEQIVFASYPELSAIKELLYHHGAVYASMSGTGSTVFGLFEKEQVFQADLPAHYFVKRVALQPVN